MATTTIQVGVETKAMLRRIGGDEPFDETIRELIYHYLDFLTELDERADAVIEGEVKTRPLEEFLRKLDEEIRSAKG